MLKIDIGIPVYNEEANIKTLLESVLAQKEDGFIISQIIVSSDGSSDKTVSIARSLKNPKVTVIANPDRRGIARGLNQIILKTKGDVLVTLDGDIAIHDSTFIKKLTGPIISGSADLTSSAIAEKLPASFYGKIVFVSMLLKEVLFGVFKKGNNVYTCHGLARSYSKKFFKSLHFPSSVGNDMYSYLRCVSENFRYQYIGNAVAWYKVPENYGDHKKQSTRFFNTILEQKKYFDSNLVEAETKIPERDYALAILKSLPILINFPIHSIAYFFLQLYMRLRSGNSKQGETWSIAASTKKND
jgi:glycosyltransferase involved in cell wall biosynthesis